MTTRTQHGGGVKHQYNWSSYYTLYLTYCWKGH